MQEPALGWIMRGNEGKTPLEQKRRRYEGRDYVMKKARNDYIVDARWW